MKIKVDRKKKERNKKKFMETIIKVKKTKERNKYKEMLVSDI